MGRVWEVGGTSVRGGWDVCERWVGRVWEVGGTCVAGGLDMCGRWVGSVHVIWYLG